MGIMGAHLWHFIVKVIDYAITLGGTSRVGFFFLLLLPPLLAGFSSVRKRVADGDKWMSALAQFKLSSLFQKPVFVIWLCLLVWSAGAITYQDHESLVAASRARGQLIASDKQTIDGLKRQLDQPPATPTGPAWTWEGVQQSPPVPYSNSTITVLVTARRPVSDLTFEVKCSIPCEFSSGMAMGFESSVWIDPQQTSDPAIIRLRVRTPNRLEEGNQLALDIHSKDHGDLSILWVHRISTGQ
jgi:hypothetical protein